MLTSSTLSASGETSLAILIVVHVAKLVGHEKEGELPDNCTVYLSSFIRLRSFIKSFCFDFCPIRYNHNVARPFVQCTAPQPIFLITNVR